MIENNGGKTEAEELARELNYRAHAEQLNIPILNGFEVQKTNDFQTLVFATSNGFTEQLVSDGYIADVEFEKRIEAVIDNTKRYMRDNNYENVDNSFIKYKDYNNGDFNFEIYFQDMMIPENNERKAIRSIIAYFVEPKMHDFYQVSISAGPFMMPTEQLKLGIIDTKNDKITVTLDNMMKVVLDNLKYKTK